MKGLIILANYFEDVEALITVDILRRANINIDLVSMEKDLNVVTAHNVIITCDKLIKKVKLSDYDFLVIPGGKAVFNYHLNSNLTTSIVDYFMKEEKLVCAICAAPAILGHLGYLKDKHFVCFPGCEENHFGGILENKNAVVDGKIITSKACGTTFDFAYEIVKALTTEENATKVINSVYYQK